MDASALAGFLGGLRRAVESGYGPARPGAKVDLSGGGLDCGRWPVTDDEISLY